MCGARRWSLFVCYTLQCCYFFYFFCHMAWRAKGLLKCFLKIDFDKTIASCFTSTRCVTLPFPHHIVLVLYFCAQHSRLKQVPTLYQTRTETQRIECLTVIKIDWYLWDFIAMAVGLCSIIFAGGVYIRFYAILECHSWILELEKKLVHKSQIAVKGAVISWLHCTLSWLSLYGINCD